MVKDQILVSDFLKKRSEESFQRLYRDKTPHIYQTALRLSQDETVAKELVQQMWVIAISKIEDFQWKSELKTWLIGILFNLYRTLRKKEEGRMEINDVETDEESYQTLNTKIDLEAAISQLAPGYRQILILHDVEGYKHREISEILDITEGTSKSQLYHARKSMRAYLNEE